MPTQSQEEFVCLVYFVCLTNGLFCLSIGLFCLCIGLFCMYTGLFPMYVDTLTLSHTYV